MAATQRRWAAPWRLPRLTWAGGRVQLACSLKSLLINLQILGVSGIDGPVVLASLVALLCWKAS